MEFSNPGIAPPPSENVSFDGIIESCISASVPASGNVGLALLGLAQSPCAVPFISCAMVPHAGDAVRPINEYNELLTPGIK